MKMMLSLTLVLILQLSSLATKDPSNVRYFKPVTYKTSDYPSTINKQYITPQYHNVVNKSNEISVSGSNFQHVRGGKSSNTVEVQYNTVENESPINSNFNQRDFGKLTKLVKENEEATKSFDSALSSLTLNTQKLIKSREEIDGLIASLKNEIESHKKQTEKILELKPTEPEMKEEPIKPEEAKPQRLRIEPKKKSAHRRAK